MDADSDNRDRISELPDSLILLILSFLQMSDAVRTTILSKRWNDRWTTLPSLKFHVPRVGDLDKFRSFTYGALLQWKGAKIFKLEFPFDNVIPHSRDLDSWLLFAIGKGVEELCMYLGRFRYVDSYYSPPLRLYSCSSIRTLTLSYVKLRVPENARLSRLTSLTVEGSKSLSELAMTRLLSGAPRLEELVLLVRNIREDYDIRSESLKILRMGRHISNLSFRGVDLRSALRIRAPNLSTLELCGFVYGGFGLDVHVPSLTTAIVYCYLKVPRREERRMFDQVIRNTSHAQSVTLSDSWIKLLIQSKEKDIPLEFSEAKYLKLYLDVIAMDQMLAVLEMFPQLVTLIVAVSITSPEDGGSSIASKKKKTSVSLSHLKTCKMGWNTSSYCGSSFALRAVEAVLGNAEVLEKMVLEPSAGFCVYEEVPGLLEKVLSMRRSSPNARVVISKGVQLHRWGCSSKA